jgi:phosphatidylglycerophosphate synthase
MAGLICGLIAGVALALTSAIPSLEGLLWLSAAALIGLRLLANMLDGMVAVTTGTASRIGELFNEIPDRLADAAILVGLGYANSGDAICGFCAALAAMFTAYIRTAAKAAGAPQDYCGPMAKPHRMAIVIVVACVCGLAPPLWLSYVTESLHLGIATLGSLIIIVGSALTSIRRLAHAYVKLRKLRV